jgi:D-glycero-D-manno-heptose 1,7-bisphosphate phosphatase
MRAVFLDRDGVLVGAPVLDGTPQADAEPVILPGVADACSRLKAAGFRLVMVTNQPDIARGVVDRATVDRANDRIRTDLDLDDVRVCPHDDDAQCDCRKPQPGMLVAAAADAGISLGDSFMVGDRWRDIEAGRRAGTITVFVDHGYDEPRPERPDHTVRSLAEAVPIIVGTTG